MLFGAFTAVFMLLALLAFYFGIKTLGKFTWFLNWVRGSIGLVFIALAIALVLIGLDLLSYKQVRSDHPILTVSFTQKAPQHFEASVSHIEEGEQQNFELYGEQWQIDARFMRWKGFMNLFGVEPGYRLERLSGRYFSLEDERSRPRSVHTLEDSEYGLDFWAFVQENGAFVPLFDAVYGTATYLPMVDGAIFQVALSPGGLSARPLNPVAEEAVEAWQ